ncbi:hypothetical protein DEA98_14655 [Brucella pseudogrignonensis]|nr:hypothetical protein [Brucella pseudogrignonensis]
MEFIQYLTLFRPCEIYAAAPIGLHQNSFWMRSNSATKRVHFYGDWEPREYLDESTFLAAQGVVVLFGFMRRQSKRALTPLSMPPKLIMTAKEQTQVRHEQAQQPSVKCPAFCCRMYVVYSPSGTEFLSVPEGVDGPTFCKLMVDRRAHPFSVP